MHHQVRLFALVLLALHLAAQPVWAGRAGTYRVQPADRRAPGYLRVSRSGIRAAARRIGQKVDLPTPLVYSAELSRRYGVEVYLKLESTTPVGSFKIRGALNTVLTLKGADRKRGVVAASTGNHAQGVAWAARQAGIPATNVKPAGATTADRS
jgi:threonine dehydratase